MITINRVQLAAELALLVNVTERQVTIPILSTVMLGLVGDTLTLTATDLNTTLVSEVAAQGETWGGCVPLRQLHDLIKLMSGDELQLTPKPNGRIEVKQGRSKHLLPVLPVSDFPDTDRPEAEGLDVDAALFNRMLNHVTFAALTISDQVKQSNFKFTGVNLTIKDGRLILAATNIMRFAVASCPLESSLELEAIIPRQAISVLESMRDSKLSIDVSPNFAHFANGQRHLYTRLIDDKFPDWQAIFPKVYGHSAEVVTDELSKAIKRAMLTTSERRFVTDGLRWTLSGDELLIETRGGDRGKSDEVVTITCPSLNGNSLQLGMNGAQVVDALSLLGEKVTCQFSDGTNIVAMLPAQSDVNFAYYINTVSLKNWQ
jgi:DNA polymerase III subunit beta